MKTKQFEVITLDVWGNEDEGFEVNDAHRTGDFITVTEETMDKAIVEALVELGYVDEKYVEFVAVNWCGDDFVEINDKRNGAFVYQLMAEGY